MSFDLKTTVQTQIELCSVDKKLNRLIDQIEQQKLLLDAWKNAKDEIRAYSQMALMPAYRELYRILYEQMQILWDSLSCYDLSKSDATQIDDKIQALASQLKDSNLLNQKQVAEVDKLYNYYVQSAEYEKSKKKKNKADSTDELGETKAVKNEFVEDDLQEDEFSEYGFNESHIDQYSHAREQAKLKRQLDKQAQAEKVVGQSLKTVYLKIAAMIHPDREQDENKKVEKTELLQRANEAYEQEDLFFLLKLQLEVEQSKHGSNKGLTAEQVKFYQQALEAQSQALQKQIKELIDSLVWSNKAKIAVQKSKGQLNISDLYKQIDADVSAVKQQLKAEKQRLSFMGKESGLEMLLEHGVL